MAAQAPAKDTFKGSITRATGSLSSFRGQVKIQLMISGTGTKRQVTVVIDGLKCATASCVRLSGSVSGTITALPANPDIGRSFRLQGGGTVSPLGRVSATGGVQGIGFIKQGHESIQLTLKGKQGQLTVSGLSPLVPGFTAP